MKYELTDDTIVIDGITLHRIKALKDFSDVKAGDLGGWIEKERNLSQIGDGWIDGNAKVYGDAVVCNARVDENAVVFGQAEVYENARVDGNAKVFDSAKIYGNTLVFGNAEIYGNAKIYGNASIFSKSKVCDNAVVHGNAQVCGGAKVYGYAHIYGNAVVHGDAQVCGDAKVYGGARVYDDAKVLGEVEVFGEVEICGNAEVYDNADYITFKNFWSSGRYFTWTKSNNMWKVGCFYGTGEELIEKAYRDSKRSGEEYERAVRYVESAITNT